VCSLLDTAPAAHFLSLQAFFRQPGWDEAGGNCHLPVLVLKREAVSNRKQAVAGLRGACRHEHQVLQVAAKSVYSELGPFRD
jgi:hypothetical protein